MDRESRGFTTLMIKIDRSIDGVKGKAGFLRKTVIEQRATLNEDEEYEIVKSAIDANLILAGQDVQQEIQAKNADGLQPVMKSQKKKSGKLPMRFSELMALKE